MTRRHFLNNTLLATGALILPLAAGNKLHAAATATPPAPRPSTPPRAPRDFKTSIMWNSVGMQGTVLEKCRAIKAAGYEAIEPMSHMNRQEVLDAANAAGLAISGVCCSTHSRKRLSDPNPAIRQEGIDGMLVALDDAKAYGADAVLFVPGFVDAKVSYDECWERSTDGVKKLLPAAEKLKVKICFENVWNNFLLSPLEACRYVDQFDSPFARFYFDTGNGLTYGGWPEQWIRILGDRIARVHIKDFSRQIADKQGRSEGSKVPLGEGDVDWPKVMAALRAHYPAPWLTTEQGSSKTPDDLKNLFTRFAKILKQPEA